MFFTEKRSGMLRMADTGAGSGGTPDAGAGGTVSQDASGGTPDVLDESAPSFETWYAGLDTTAKGFIDAHVNGLKTALVTERNEQRTLLAKLQKGAEKGSELERQLAEMQNTIASAERRATFAEDAIRPEIGCSNVKAAYALAVAEGLFDSRGRPDWAGLKSAAPELFRKPGPGSADGGAGVNHGPKLDMNSIIRRAAGRS